MRMSFLVFANYDDDDGDDDGDNDGDDDGNDEEMQSLLLSGDD